MPKEDISFSCKKRHHPDGSDLSSSKPKRLLSISEAELGSSIESVHDSVIPSASTIGSHGSFWKSASSVVIPSDCSTSMFVGRAMPANVVSSRPPSLAFVHSQTPSDTASYNSEAAKAVRDSSIAEKCKSIWTYRTAAYEREESSLDEYYSEVTDGGTSTSTREPEGVYPFGKATHVISRREKSSLKPKWGMDEAWLNDGYEDHLSRENRLESHGSLHSNRLWRREYNSSSLAGETGSSWAAGASHLEELRSKQGLPHIHGPVCKESFAGAADVLVRLQMQDSTKNFEQSSSQSHVTYEADMHSNISHAGKVKEQNPAYVLSSGRLSLEEEARLGRRAPTIDHDFEEYFSSLML